MYTHLRFASSILAIGGAWGPRPVGRLILGTLACCALSGCGARPEASAMDSPVQESPPVDWAAQIGAAHPLTGRIWRAKDGAFVEPDALIEAARGADFVLIGERHDHPDHHRLQGWILGDLVTEGGHEAVAFEMLDADDRAALATLPPATAPAELAEAVAWAESGWPAFDLYAPIFQAILKAEVDILPGNPAREQLKAVMMQGYSALPQALVDRLALDHPLEPHLEESLRAEIVTAHCGHAGGALIPAMARGQRLKDATMADTLLGAKAQGRRAVLITGNGHARVDRGVPWYLRARGAEATISIGLIQVEAGSEAPEGYDTMPFDYIWFTPRLDDVDPCERFKARLEKMKAAHGGKLPPAAEPAPAPASAPAPAPAADR